MRRFWEDYPKKFWTEPDWQAWEKAGRPRVPAHLDLQPPPPQEMSETPPLPPGPQLAPGFTLFSKLSSRREAGSARSRAVDRLIEKHVGR